jgi:hypothetical protein
MPQSNRFLLAGLLLACVSLSACAKPSTFDNQAASNEGPAKVERVTGTDLIRVILTAKAAERLGIETARVRIVHGARGGHARRTVIPYAAVLYDPDGQASTYTSPQPFVFVRRHISVDHVSGGMAVLKSGPPAGTAVVTVGSAELLGTEYGVAEQ